MSNSGTRKGTGADTWRFYTPELAATTSPGQATPTQPSLGNADVSGRWLRTPAGIVIAQANFTFGSTTTFGSITNNVSTTQAFIVKLPFPANRWTTTFGVSTADLPIGSALAWQGSAANPSLTMPLVPTLADPLAPINNQTNEDYYAHLFIPHSIAYGTATIAQGTNSITVNHDLGVVPTAYDITITPTGSPTTAPRNWYVTNITATTFDVNTGASLTTGTLPFSWKARVEPNNSLSFPQLVNPVRPWRWASGHGLYCQFIYEGRY